MLENAALEFFSLKKFQRTHFVFINKTVFLASTKLTCGVALISTAFFQLKLLVSRKKSMQKYYNTLKLMWKEFGTKLLDNFRKCWKTQHWSFEKVLEHFVMFTELVNTS